MPIGQPSRPPWSHCLMQTGRTYEPFAEQPFTLGFTGSGVSRVRIQQVTTVLHLVAICTIHYTQSPRQRCSAGGRTCAREDQRGPDLRTAASAGDRRWSIRSKVVQRHTLCISENRRRLPFHRGHCCHDHSISIAARCWSGCGCTRSSRRATGSGSGRATTSCKNHYQQEAGGQEKAPRKHCKFSFIAIIPNWTLMVCDLCLAIGRPLLSRIIRSVARSLKRMRPPRPAFKVPFLLEIHQQVTSLSLDATQPIS